MESLYHHADEIIKNNLGNGLWIGDCAAAEDIAWLKQKNIKTVITTASGFNLTYDSSLKHYKYELLDKKTENISKYFDLISYQIEKCLRAGGVLVHCGAGVSRSSTIVIAYLIKYKGMCFSTALKYCKTKRPQVCPNLGFQLQLKSYEKLINESLKLPNDSEKEAKQLPELVKHKASELFRNTQNRSFLNMRQSIIRKENSILSKSLRPEIKEEKEAEYLRKMAEFRFGITNMGRWKIGLAGHKKKQALKI